MPKVSCLSHEGEHRGEEKHPIDRKQVKKKRAFFKPESQSCFKPDCDIRTQIGNNCKFSCVEEKQE